VDVILRNAASVISGATGCQLPRSVTKRGGSVRNIFEENARQGQQMSQALAYSSAAVEHFTL
jgi:hypothetical protein